jgi:hypothetical protein
MAVTFATSAATLFHVPYNWGLPRAVAIAPDCRRSTRGVAPALAAETEPAAGDPDFSLGAALNDGRLDAEDAAWSITTAAALQARTRPGYELSAMPR